MINIDFETRSRVNLKNSGAYRYAEDESTEVLFVAWAEGDEEPFLWEKGQPDPVNLFAHIKRVLFSAFNSEFEMAVWREICVKRLGWPPIPDESWVDTMIDSLCMGLPKNLEDCALAVGAIHQKDPAGKKLIQKLCKPISSGKKKGEFRRRKDFPDDFRRLGLYCQQDVRTERAVGSSLPFLATRDPYERSLWLNTVKMNRRGLPIDIPTVTKMQSLILEKKDKLDDEVDRMSIYFKTPKGVAKKLGSSRQREALRVHLEDVYKLDVPNMQNLTVENLLEKESLPRNARTLLQNRRDMNHPSVAKIKKAFAQMCRDDTVKGCYVHCGAGTRRYTASGFQPQNFPRLKTSYQNSAIACVNSMPLEDLELIFGNSLHLFSALLRPIIKAPSGYKFFNSDLSQIEARMTAWIAKELPILDAYAKGLDVYRVLAAEMYHVLYESVTGDQRQAGKTGVLACGFGGAHKALIKMGEKYGITFTKDEAVRIVNAFRAARSKLVDMWGFFGNAARDALLNPGYKINVKENPLFFFIVKGEWMYLGMPNGQHIHFPFPEWRMWTTPWGQRKEQVTYMSVNSQTRKWERQSSTGASLFQSAVQGLSRDVLMEAHKRVESAGYPVIMTVHDELVSRVPDTADFKLDDFIELFVQNPKWCKDLPLSCDSWEGYRYKK